MIECGISLVDIEQIEVVPLNDLSRVIIDYQVIFHLFIEENGEMMVLSGSIMFSKDIILYVPDQNPMSIKGQFKGKCLKVERIGNVIRTTIGVFAVIQSGLEVQLLVPSYGFCITPEVCKGFSDDPCAILIEEEIVSSGNSLNKFEFSEIDCIITTKIYDACSQKDCGTTENIIPHTMPPDPPDPKCVPPIARSMGFWGRGMGGIRALIEDGVVDLEEFITEVVIPIVGPGGRSEFLGSFFNEDLFVPEPDIEGIYNRYLELYSMPPMGILQLAIMLLTTYMNVQSTAVGLLPPNEVCLDEDTTFYVESIVDIDLVECTFDVDLGVASLIVDLLNNIEAILDNCCPDAENCVLTPDHRSQLIRILNNINNSQGIFVVMNTN